MKKFKTIYILLCMGLLCTSCNDFLETKSPSVLSSETVFTTEAMTKSAIMGIYSTLISDNLYKGRIPCNWQGVSDIEFGRNESNSGEDGFPNYWCDIYESRCRWTDGFKLAELATTAIDGIRKSPLMETKADIMKAYLGEALVLRALAYFELVRYWGDVPFKEETSNSDLSNVYIGKVDRDIIYDGIISNLQEAIEYLPWMGNGEYTAERVTKGFAYGLLARVALFAGGYSVRDANEFSDANVEHLERIEELNGYYVGRRKDYLKYYDIAEKACATLIGNSDNPHQLDVDFGDIWKTVCHLELNKYNENLFEVATGMSQNGDIGNLMGYSMGTNTKYTGGRGMGGNYSTSNAYYFYSFDPEDIRRDYSVYWGAYAHDNTNNIDRETIKGDPLNVCFNKWNFFWTTDEWRTMLKAATNRLGNGINWIIMRYSDVLLMYAEAANELYGPDYVDEIAGITPRQALEKVRERAFGTNSSKVKIKAVGKDDFFDAIVNERAWEFGGEAIRKMDLIRWGILDTKLDDMKRALCYMMDGTQNVTCFDKTYPVGSLPTMLYYTYYDEDSPSVISGEKAPNEFIDMSSDKINFYKELGTNPGGDGENAYQEVEWLSAKYQMDEKNPDDLGFLDGYVKVLKLGSGLMSTYDYSELYGTLKYGEYLRNRMATEKMGNGKCNYRHLFAIYNEDVYESKGLVTNSYGY